jgi:transcriptional regulator with XRE-family HTH domain
LRAQRMRRGLGLREVARRLGLNEATVSLVERNMRSCPDSLRALVESWQVGGRVDEHG